MQLGLDRCVFASFGVAAYRDPPVVLCFGPAEEMRESRQSVPWDSRGAGAAAGWKSNPERHAEMIARYWLGAPEDEQYLAAHLATCFQQWDVFLSGERPVQVDSARVLANPLRGAKDEDLVPLTTPEARFDSALVLGEKLLAGFVDADYPERGPQTALWRETFLVLQRVLEKHGRPFHSWRRYKSREDIRGFAATFVRNWLREGGHLP
jgi:hypothetical protein